MPLPSLSEVLLTWYDHAGRDLPWRQKGGNHAEPYHVWLSEVMLQQTIVETVKPYFAHFINKWPDLPSFYAAQEEEVLAAWSGLGYYRRARLLKNCAEVLMRDYGGIFPQKAEEWLQLPGIGAYTAAAICAICFNQRVAVIDGNVERVMARLYAIEVPKKQARTIFTPKLLPLVPPQRAGDFAQAMMDLGAMICIPKQPRCTSCPLTDFCLAYQQGEVARFPLKEKKKARLVLFTHVWLMRTREGEILFGRRPAKGVLANMLEVPSSAWLPSEISSQEARKNAPFQANWQEKTDKISHIFTHIELYLEVHHAVIEDKLDATPLFWLKEEKLQQYPLPSLYKKVINTQKT